MHLLVIPAKAGIQALILPSARAKLKLDSRLRGSDEHGSGSDERRSGSGEG